MDLHNNRREYQYGRLTRNSLLESPFDQFRSWMDQAVGAGIQDPTAMCLGTVDETGKPWQRIVLLKDFDHRGFVFYTNLGSRKAREMGANHNVSLHFPWLQLDRQVIVAGTVSRVSKAEAIKYFLSRPRDSQLAAWTSQQSNPVNSRQALEAQFLQMKSKFSNGDIPLPDFWGGYRIEPTEWEFWQGGENRLHDRFSYQLNSRSEGQVWNITQLAP